MTDIIVPDDLFPVDDGIGLEVTDGVDPRYDLRRWMDPTMRNRPQWEDFAIASSAVLWELFEKHRVALKLAWTPQNVARVFKVLALKTLGLDYRSDALTDDDYDRIIDTISQYNASKGPPHFVRYMGFMRGQSLEMVKLWTENYKDFHPAPGIGWKTVIDDRVNGTWYSTPHVGILYERYLAPNGVDEVDLRDLFYKMAPIHLVLEWIAANVTLSVGTLYMVTNSLVRKDYTLQVEYNKKADLYASTKLLARLDHTTSTWPDEPFVKQTLRASVAGVSAGSDDAVARTGTAAWCSDADDESYLLLATDPTFTVRWRDAYGVLHWGAPGAQTGYAANRSRLGVKLTPTRLNWAPEARYPGTGAWSLQGVHLAGSGSAAPDGATTVRLSAAPAASILCGVRLPVGSEQTGAVQWLLKPDSGGARFAIRRGSDLAVFDPAGPSVVSHATSGPALHGVEALPGGFVLAWACLVGADVELIPQYTATVPPPSTPVVNVDHAWLQVETEPYPSDLISTGATRAGRGGSSVQLRDPSQLEFPRGFGLLTFAMDYPEWERGQVIILEAVSSSGFFADLTLRVNTGGVLELHGPNGEVVTGGPVVAGVKRTICFSWGPGELRLHGAGSYAQTVACAQWPSNFNRITVGAADGDVPYGTLWLDRVMIVGSADPSALPSASVLNAISA